MAKGKTKMRIVMEIEVPNDFNSSYIENYFDELDVELSERFVEDFSDPEDDNIEMTHLEVTKIIRHYGK